jgi:hypothetical protein
MGLTRVRAEQISNIDYKQAVRVITLTNVTLSGGAPRQVDGVNLNTNDRILVAGQTIASQNGLYDVQVLGSGSDGTWVRTPDANTTGEISAGMIVMVTEGNTYADTSWKLITDDPIVIDTTGLTFTQNTGNSFSIINVVGSDNVVANGVSSTVSFLSGNNFTITGNNASDNITFAVSDNPTFTTVSATGNITGSGNISIAGNIVAGGVRSSSQATAPTNPSVGDFWYNTTTNSQYRYTFDGTDYFWLDDFGSTTAASGTFSAITSGTSNVSIYSANANVEVNIAGTGNIAVFSTTGAAVTGLTVTTSSTPATSSSTGVTGQIQWDSDYIYVCVAPNTWKRASINTW